MNKLLLAIILIASIQLSQQSKEKEVLLLHFQEIFNEKWNPQIQEQSLFCDGEMDGETFFVALQPYISSPQYYNQYYTWSFYNGQFTNTTTNLKSPQACVIEQKEDGEFQLPCPLSLGGKFWLDGEMVNQEVEKINDFFSNPGQIFQEMIDEANNNNYETWWFDLTIPQFFEEQYNKFNCSFTFTEQTKIVPYIKYEDTVGCLNVNNISLTLRDIGALGLYDFKGQNKTLSFQLTQLKQDPLNSNQYTPDKDTFFFYENMTIEEEVTKTIDLNKSFNLIQNAQFIDGSASFYTEVKLGFKTIATGIITNMDDSQPDESPLLIADNYILEWGVKYNTDDSKCPSVTPSSSPSSSNFLNPV